MYEKIFFNNNIIHLQMIIHIIYNNLVSNIIIIILIIECIKLKKS